MISIESITPDNLEHAVSLLQKRGNTLPEYTRWKYCSAGTAFCGVIGYLDKKPAGCFGLVPRELYLPTDQETIKCGWFCDWYVLPEYQGHGLGRELLLALSNGYKVIFGHPGPKKASSIALNNGFRPISFQSRRRLYFNRLAYERVRTRHTTKLIYRLALGSWRALRDRIGGQTKILEKQTSTEKPVPYFTGAEEYGEWILAQPVMRTHIQRQTGWWQSDCIKVAYADDDLFLVNERRRRILFTCGERRFDKLAWAQFVLHARQSQCDYIEFFTTEPELDAVWQTLGALRVPESPVLVKGLPPSVNHFAFHAWDRENWTHQAMGAIMPIHNERIPHAIENS